MSSPDPSTSLLDSTMNESKCDLAAVLSCDLEDDFMDMASINEPLEALSSEKPSPSKQVLETECDKWVPVDYRGTMTMPLSYFGTFEVKHETKDFPWISDNTSGAVHPDMHTVSMLFNETLTLPRAARKFVEQSSALREEARWERVKAVFYLFYPEDLKRQVFEVLSKMSSRDASRVIAKKTSRYENEVISIPNPKKIDPWVDTDPDSDPETESDHHVEAESCNEEDAMTLNSGFPNIASEYKETIAAALNHTKSPREKLAEYDFFKATGVMFNNDIIRNSTSWANELEKYQKLTRNYIETCLSSHHFGHAVARYEPRTGWIHVKTQLLRQNLQENKKLQNEFFGVKLFSDYKIRGTPEAQRAAINKQMGCFEHGFQDYTKGQVPNYDFYHNEPGFYEFRFSLPCEKISPDYCGTVLQTYLHKNERYCVISTPQVLSYPISHHEMKVYIQAGKDQKLCESESVYGSTLEYVNPLECCPNCFSKAHVGWKCDKPKYGFALAT